VPDRWAGFSCRLLWFGRRVQSEAVLKWFMAFRGKTIGNWTRVLTFTLAVLFVVFLTQTATHTHQNGQHETTCQVCHAAHLGSILPSGTLSLSATPQSVGYVEPFVAAYHEEFFFHDSPSRAPPSFPL